jgi:hypothetical protein
MLDGSGGDRHLNWRSIGLKLHETNISLLQLISKKSGGSVLRVKPSRGYDRSSNLTGQHLPQSLTRISQLNTALSSINIFD